MKKILMMAAFLFSAAMVFAQWQNTGNRGPIDNGQYNNYQNSSLIVIANTQNRFTVMVDNGYQYQSSGNVGYGSTVNVGTLSAGNHSITIYEMSTGFFGKQKQRVIYNSNLYFKPNVETTININNYGQVGVVERPLFQNTNSGYGNQRRKPRCRRDRDDDDRDGRRNNDNRNGNGGGYNK
jgi:hypothetical protein